MSIASELSALNGYILGAYDEINDKGGTVPQNKNMANLASAIASISGGGGGGGGIATGTFTTGATIETSRVVTHALGVLPDLFVCVCIAGDALASDYSGTTRGGTFWICATNMPKGGSSGWAGSGTARGLQARTANASSLSYGTFASETALATSTTGTGIRFNMDTNTATLKSPNTTYGLGTNRTFFWIAIADTDGA